MRRALKLVSQGAVVTMEYIGNRTQALEWYQFE